jgi:hypothetical protein
MAANATCNTRGYYLLFQKLANYLFLNKSYLSVGTVLLNMDITKDKQENRYNHFDS